MDREVGWRRLVARAGVRLALLQALIVIVSFALAGTLTRLAMDQVQTAAMRERVQGEVRSMEEEFAQKGAAHLPHTVAKRTRIWRGFAYRLAGADGRLAAGTLPAGASGWFDVAGAPGAADNARRPFLVFSERLPDGSRLSVGQDLSAYVRQSAALTWTLLLCGAFGVIVCVAASAAFSGRTWRRVAAVSAVAREVRNGRLESRVVASAGEPRDDLDDLGHAFNAMLDRVGALMSQVRQVSTGIAHDLRTPLTRVGQRLERLRADSACDPRVAAGLNRVEADIGEILRTFDALLQMAEIDADDARRHDRALDLSAVVVRVGEAFRPDIEEGGRSLVMDCAPASISGDEHLLAQAVSNLIENAMRHTQPGARVVVRVAAGPEVRLTVDDDGPGVPEERRADVLRPLVRLDASRRLPGSGMGLALVAAVAARHRAKLTLTDARPGLRVTLAFAS